MEEAFSNVPERFVTKTKVYDSKEKLSDALTSINKLGAVIVTRDKEYKGIVDSKALSLRNTLKLIDTVQIGKFARIVPLLDSSTSIAKAALYFYDSAARALPYYEKERLRGVVKREEILKSILSLHILSKQNAEAIMSTPLIAISPDVTVTKALKLMEENKVRRLAVVQNGRLAGIITYKNIRQYTAKMQARPERIRRELSQEVDLSSIIERNVHTINSDEGADEGIRKMVENGVSSIVVLKKGRPAGMLTMRDVFKSVILGSNVTANNILIAGLDTYTKEYEDEIKEAFDALAEKVNKFSKFKVDFISVDVKRSKSRNFELKARLGLRRGGVISDSSFNYDLEMALKEVIDRLYKSVKKRKELIITGKESGSRPEEE